MVDCLDGIAEIISAARFHFYERDKIILLRDEIDIAAAALESTREDFPAGVLEIARRDSLTQLAEGIRGFGHGSMVQTSAPFCIIESTTGRSV